MTYDHLVYGTGKVLCPMQNIPHSTNSESTEAVKTS